MEVAEAEEEATGGSKKECARAVEVSALTYDHLSDTRPIKDAVLTDGRLFEGILD